MKSRTMLRLAAAPALALFALSGCATGFKANVARFQQMPPVQGQRFMVVAEDSRKSGGLEFAHYAEHVARHMSAHGYVPVDDPAAAQMIVRVDYDVDQGHERVVSYGHGWGRGWYGPWGHPYYGWRRPYYWGFYDPFLFDSYPDVRSYTVYNSQLKLRIDNAANGTALFEGTARAQSTSNNLTYLVPKLIDAIFTGFPGNSGEEIKVTVPPEPKNS